MKHGLNLSCQIKSILATYFFAENFIDIFSQVESFCCYKFISAFSFYLFFFLIHGALREYTHWWIVFSSGFITLKRWATRLSAYLEMLKVAACSVETYFTNYSIITSLYHYKYCVYIDGIGIARCVALQTSVFLSSTSRRATFTT